MPEKTKLCGFSPGLIQGCITFSVSPLESRNNFVISLLNRHESGLLYTTSGRNLVVLTQSQGKVYVRYIMHQGLKSGAAVTSITVIKRLGLFYLSSCFWSTWKYFKQAFEKDAGSLKMLCLRLGLLLVSNVLSQQGRWARDCSLSSFWVRQWICIFSPPVTGEIRRTSALVSIKSWNGFGLDGTLKIF